MRQSGGVIIATSVCFGLALLVHCDPFVGTEVADASSLEAGPGDVTTPQDAAKQDGGGDEPRPRYCESFDAGAAGFCDDFDREGDAGTFIGWSFFPRPDGGGTRLAYASDGFSPPYAFLSEVAQGRVDTRARLVRTLPRGKKFSVRVKLRGTQPPTRGALYFLQLEMQAPPATIFVSLRGQGSADRVRLDVRDNVQNAEVLDLPISGALGVNPTTWSEMVLALDTTVGGRIELSFDDQRAEATYPLLSALPQTPILEIGSYAANAPAPIDYQLQFDDVSVVVTP
jgi:hypothetical protein